MTVSIDVIVPAHQERDNIKPLIEQLSNVREANSLNLKLYVVDDNSQDGTGEEVEKFQLPWVNLIKRTSPPDLSGAVLKGINAGSGDIIFVMDADLSHPPETIPEMVDELTQGADFVVGSRYIDGGSTDDNWGVIRWLTSQVATLLARPFAKIKDPMSGFFAMHRKTYETAEYFTPIGYKIGLELIVKCKCKRVVEVPIHFTDRIHGESKLTIKEQLKYLQHIRRLFIYKYANSTEVLQFLIVGLSGLFVNLGVLTLMLLLGAAPKIAVLIAIGVSICTNFLLNRRFTFPYSRKAPITFQFFKYVASVSVGAIINAGVTLSLITLYPEMLTHFASLMGIIAATIINFTTMKYLVFKKRHYKSK